MANNLLLDVLIRVRNQTVGFLGTLGAIATLKALVSNIEEAQAAAAQLDSAFKATGQGLGLTRTRLDELATSLQETTTLSDDLVKQAEAVLLTFNKVRGEGFERTIKAAADLSARFGTDLVSSTKLLGKALQDPVSGLTQLRRAGVTFTDSQKDLIKNLAETGQRAQAQNIILAEVEKRFKGAAEAARTTLGGALEGLKNAFGDIFEGTEKGTSSAVKSINELSKAFNDPKLKEGIDTAISGISKLTEATIIFTNFVLGQFVQAGDFFGEKIGNLTTKVMGFKDSNQQLNDLIEKRAKLLKDLDTIQFSKSRASFPSAKDRDDLVKDLKLQLTKTETDIKVLRETFRQDTFKEKKPVEVTKSSNPLINVEDEIDASSLVTEVIIKDLKIRTDANEQFFLDLDNRTKTSIGKQVTDYEELKRSLQELFEAGRISAEEFNERLDEATDNLLPKIDTSAIRAQLRTVGQQAQETSLIIKGAFEQAGASIQATLSDAIQSGKLSLKSLVDVARKAIADILAAIIVSGIKKAIASQFSGTGGGGGKAGFFGSLFGALSGSGGGAAGSIGALIGGGAGGGASLTGKSDGSLPGLLMSAKAGGGLATMPFIAGEEGRELIVPRAGGAQVFNKRQLQFMGGGNGAVFAPQTNISIIERENPEQTRQEIFRVVALQNARNEERFMQRLAKNGVTVR